jgi:hypothetical protein
MPSIAAIVVQWFGDMTNCVASSYVGSVLALAPNHTNMKLRHLSFIPVYLLLASCAEHVVAGHGATKTETQALPSTTFDKVAISAPVDAHISIGGAPSLSFEGFANLFPYLHTEVSNGTLRIFTDEGTELSTDKNVIANITLPSLAGLALHGSSDAIVNGVVQVPKFALDVSGSAAVDIQEVHVQTFDADMSGSADLKIGTGDIGDGSFEVSGSGAIKAFGVMQQHTALELSGSADVEVAVADKLDVDISGAGSVVYKGHPKITQEVSGSGSIREAN